MNKHVLKQLIRETIEEVLQENTKTYKWQDGTEIMLSGFGEIVGGKYKGEDINVSEWKNLGWANGWPQGFYDKEVAPKIKNVSGYEIRMNTKGTDHLYVYPEPKVYYRVDSSD